MLLLPSSPRKIVVCVAASLTLGGCFGRTSESRLPVPVVSATGPVLIIDPDAALLRADEAWKAEKYDVAGAVYDSLVRSDSTAFSIAFFRLATIRAWDKKVVESERLYRRYVVLEPKDAEGRLALARSLAWRGDHTAAVAIYDSVLISDSTYRDAATGRAQTLAWAERMAESLRAYRRWIAWHPDDLEAQLDFARTLSWNGQFDEAEAVYGRYARQGNVDAQKGMALIAGWRGNLVQSEQAWKRIIKVRPDDAEALTGLAQIYRWKGQTLDADAALREALRVRPGYGNAMALLRYVEADLKPTVSTTVVGTNDSDNNRLAILQLDFTTVARWKGNVGASYSERRADLGPLVSRSRAVSALATWQPLGSPWTVRMNAGLANMSSSQQPVNANRRIIGAGRVRISGAASEKIRVGFGAATGPFDESAALIASGLVISDVGADASVALPAGLNVSGAFGYSRVTRGTRPNSREASSGSLRWTKSRKWSFAIGARQFGYDTVSADRYFAPQRYRLAEASVRGSLGGDLGWNSEADIALGKQNILFFGYDAGSRLAERVAASLGYRFAPPMEVSLFGSYANVASPVQQARSEYSAYSVGLRGRIGF